MSGERLTTAEACHAWLLAEGFHIRNDWFISPDHWLRIANPLVLCPWTSVADLRAAVVAANDLKPLGWEAVTDTVAMALPGSPA